MQEITTRTFDGGEFTIYRFRHPRYGEMSWLDGGVGNALYSKITGKQRQWDKWRPILWPEAQQIAYHLSNLWDIPDLLPTVECRVEGMTEKIWHELSEIDQPFRMQVSVRMDQFNKPGPIRAIRRFLFGKKRERAFFERLAMLNYLVGLEVHFTYAEDADMELLKGFHQLQSLTLDAEDGRLSDDGMLSLDDFPMLFRLNFEDRGRVTEAGFQVLNRFTSLRSLRVYQSAGFTSRSLAGLAALPHLRELEFSETDIFTDAGISALNKMTALEELIFIDCPLTDARLAQLKSLPNLRYLYLELYLDDFEGLTENACACLTDFPKLRRLYLGSGNITDASLADIGRLTQLETLDLSDCEEITDAGLPHLHGLKNLRELSLSREGHVSPEALETLRRHMTWCKIEV